MVQQLDDELAESIIGTLGANFTKVALHDFVLETDYSSKTEVKYKGDHIVSLEEDQLTVKELQYLHQIANQYSKEGRELPDHVEWEPNPESHSLRTWETQIDNNPVAISVDRPKSENSFTVTAPVEDIQRQNYRYASDSDVAGTDGKSFSTFENAFVYAVWYMLHYHPHTVDKAVRSEEIARDRFQDIPGIGTKKAREAVDEQHIRTFEQLKDSVGRIVDRNYRDDAKEAVEEKLNTGGEVTNDSHVREISSILLAENI